MEVDDVGMKQDVEEGWRAEMSQGEGVVWQEEASGSGLESWQAGRQVSSGPGVLKREELGKISRQVGSLKYKLELKGIQQSGDEWMRSRGRYIAG